MFTQKELLAHRVYLQYGVRVKLKLSAGALRIAQRKGAALRAGLQELAFAQQPYIRRDTFESNEQFDTWLLAARASVHAATVASEVHA